MNLLVWLRSLGNTGAVANARGLRDERRREAWLVAGLARRLDLSDIPFELPGTASAA